MNSLRERWKLFGSIVFDPWTLCLISAIIFLIYKSRTNTNASTLTLTLITILITLSSAVLGSRITKQWVNITEGGILIARGKSAVRGLKLLLSSIISLDKRVQYYLTMTRGRNIHSEVITTCLEEIRERCNTLAEESVNSIENWTDIVPEADVKTHIGIISDLKFKLENTEKDLNALESDLNKTKDKSEEKRNLLRNKVRDKEKEISELQEELRKKQAGFGINIIPNSTPYATLSDVGHTYLNNIIIGRAEPDLNNSSWAIAEQDKNKELKEDDD